MEVLEDLALGRRVKDSGFAQRVALGLDLVRVRWAQGAFGVVDNLTKNLFALFHFRPELVLALRARVGRVRTLFPIVACLARPCASGGLLVCSGGIVARLSAGRASTTTFRQRRCRLPARQLVCCSTRCCGPCCWRCGAAAVTWRGTFYLAQLRRSDGEK